MSDNWLFKRGKTYYLRAHVPADLVDFVGKREIWRTLKTAHVGEARKRLRDASKEVRLYFDWARQERDFLMERLEPTKTKGRKRRLRKVPPSFEAILRSIERRTDGAMESLPTTGPPPAVDLLAALARDFPHCRVSGILRLHDVFETWARAFPDKGLQEVLVAVQNEKQRRNAAEDHHHLRLVPPEEP